MVFMIFVSEVMLKALVGQPFFSAGRAKTSCNTPVFVEEEGTFDGFFRAGWSPAKFCDLVRESESSPK